MSNSSITDFEDRIAEAKQRYIAACREMLAYVTNGVDDTSALQTKLNELHTLAVDYFNLFSRSIAEYSTEGYDLNDNVLRSKCHDAVHMCETIIKHWQSLQGYQKKYAVHIPTPSENAYANIQSLVNTYAKKATSRTLLTKFKEVGLPITGFDSAQKFIDMRNKKFILLGGISGLCMIIAIATLTFFVSCPTEFQNKMFSICIAIGAAAFAVFISGFIKFNYQGIVTAGGAMAIFAIIFFVKPTELSDYKSCQKNISGTVYVNGRPEPGIEVRLIKFNVSTLTDNFGNFRLNLDLSTVEEMVEINVKDIARAIDSSMRIPVLDLEKGADIRVNSAY